jgi:hypothetical protein
MNREPATPASPAPGPIHAQHCECWRCLDAARHHDRAGPIAGGLIILVSAMIVLGCIFGAAFELLAAWATRP